MGVSWNLGFSSAVEITLLKGRFQPSGRQEVQPYPEARGRTRKWFGRGRPGKIVVEVSLGQPAVDQGQVPDLNAVKSAKGRQPGTITTEAQMGIRLRVGRGEGGQLSAGGAVQQ